MKDHKTQTKNGIEAYISCNVLEELSNYGPASGWTLECQMS